MKIIIGSLNKFHIYLLLTWLVILVYNYELNSYSKLTYYVESDVEFMRPLNLYLNQSLITIKKLNKWIRHFNMTKPLFNKKQHF